MKCMLRFKNLDTNNIIPAIKEVRAITGMGLYNSKCFVERAKNIYSPFETELDTTAVINSFRKLGITVQIKDVEYKTGEKISPPQNIQTPQPPNPNPNPNPNVTITDLREKENHTTISFNTIPTGYFTGTIVYNRNSNRYIGLFLAVNEYVVAVDAPHMSWSINSNALCENYQPVRVEVLIKENL